MSKTVISIHGFASPSGRGQTDRFRPFWQDFGYDFIEFDYGFVGLLGVAFGNQERAEKLAAITPPGSVAFCHSNGFAIAAEASRLGAPFSQIVGISPAAPSKVEIGAQVSRIHIWHSKGDFPLFVAQFLSVIGWGNLGAVGYKGKDARFTNYNKSSYRIPSKTHLDIFTEPRLSYFAPIIIGHVEEAAAQIERQA